MTAFRLAVAGSRELTDRLFVFGKLDSMLANRLPNVAILTGNCGGTDAIAVTWSIEVLRQPPVIFGTVLEPGKDTRHPGEQAEEMLQNCDAMLAFPKWPTSLGTQDCICRAVGTRTPIVVYWVELDVLGMVKRLVHTNAYNRKPLAREVVT